MLLIFLWKNVFDLLLELEIEVSLVIRDGRVFGLSLVRLEFFFVCNGVFLCWFFINLVV